MSETLAKDTLKNTLSLGTKAATDFLYTRYGAMLYGYVLQFFSDQNEAEQVFIKIFSLLSNKLNDACNSPLNVYCWMQVQAREVILQHKGNGRNGFSCYYTGLLQDAPKDLQFVFTELYLKGKHRKVVAESLNKEEASVNELLYEALSIIRSKIS